jgi:protein-L-isoaspartate(D-aspartate) O-methyltransferase
VDFDTERETTQPDPAATVNRWRQVNLTFSDWQNAEQYAATLLAAALTVAENNGVITGFWFVRKRETWRLRLQPSGRLAEFYALLATITDDDRVQGVTEPMYRPEQYALGGPQATDLAHTFFHVDSRHVLLRDAKDQNR